MAATLPHALLLCARDGVLRGPYQLYEGLDLEARSIVCHYGPYRLVGENDALAASVLKFLDHPPDLARDLIPHTTCVALLLGLPDADDGQEVGLHRTLRLPGDHLVGLAEDFPPLGVAHDDRAGIDVE